MPYRPGQVQGLERQLQGLLNKLTPDNFQNVSGQICDLEIKTLQDVKLLTSKLFAKAVSEQSYLTRTIL